MGAAMACQVTGVFSRCAWPFPANPVAGGASSLWSPATTEYSCRNISAQYITSLSPFCSRDGANALSTTLEHGGREAWLPPIRSRLDKAQWPDYSQGATWYPGAPGALIT